MKDNTDEFDLRLEISDMMWEVDRLREIEAILCRFRRIRKSRSCTC